MREVAATLGTHYPSMFHASKHEFGILGFKPTKKVLNLNDLASNLIDRVSSTVISL